MFGKSLNAIAESCKSIRYSDVYAKVSGLHGKNATGQKSAVGSFECQCECVEYRPYASHKRLYSKQILQKNRGREKLKQK